MVKKLQVTSLELLSHPGESLLEIIEDRGISQKELAIRTGFTEKHISTVLHQKRPISAEFAQALEYALGIKASFWTNLQSKYDLEVSKYNEVNQISDEELNYAKKINLIWNKITDRKTQVDSEKIVFFRKLFGVRNLLSIPKLNTPCYRYTENNSIDGETMFIWQYFCEKLTENQTVVPFDIEMLKSRLESLKRVMLLPSNHLEDIQNILNECGIRFIVLPHVKEAPINGLTCKTSNDQVMIALSLKGRYTDIFWFTLFHEIAHILNEDYQNPKNFEKYNNEIEERANHFSRDFLINPDLYERFVENRDFSDHAIKRLSNAAGVLPTIVYGRLMKDRYIPWSNSHKRTQYQFTEK